ncbi:hypothetical protein AB0D66_29385 [Streptomyces sp. NPDC048270]|uniref:hypothetical protein n=1 Tax=Streptomyces sp. NPDC048270 TaxID=3154615 RepID=UPI0033F27D57
MVPDAGVVHEHVLWAVNTVIEQCWGADRHTVERSLAEAFEAAGFMHSRSTAAQVIGSYFPDTADLLLHYLATQPGDEARPADDPVTAWLHEVLRALAQDLASALEADAWSGYESPSLTGPVHDVPELAPEPAPGQHPAQPRETGRPARTGDPRAAARKKTERTERARRAAQQVIEDLDWSAIDAENRVLLKQLSVGERLLVFWVKTRGIIVVGMNNTAFAPLDKVRQVPGLGVFAGSLQLVSKPKLLSARREAVITDIPREEAEALCSLLRIHKIEASLTGSSRWVG